MTVGDLDEFRLVRPLGRGGMGEVFLGHDTVLDRAVAIKLIGAHEPDAASRERFLTEARAIARLSHPNVVTIFRVGTTGDGRPFLVQELIRGRSLDQVARPLPWRQVCELAVGIARGLDAAHRRGILHRDVKPANVMLDDQGNARLLDFGLAKLTAATEVAPGPRALEPRARSADDPADLLATRDRPGAGSPGAVGEERVDRPGAGSPGAAGEERADRRGASSPGAAGEERADRPGAGSPGAAREEQVDRPAVAADAVGDDRPRAVTSTRAAEAALAVADTRHAAIAALGVAETRAQRPDPPRLGAADRPSRVPASSAPGPGASAAIEQTGPGSVIGTPRYTAPEIWRGEPASVRTDLYSLGVMLYELAAGVPPYPQSELAELENAVLAGGARPVEELVPELAPAVARLVMQCIALDPRGRPGSAAELVHELEAALVDAPVIRGGNPYRGLRAFDAEHRGMFFGRGADISVLVDRLRTEPLLVVTGDSGIGKSSVCHAGVVPAVIAGALADRRRWRAVSIVPGRRPWDALCDALAIGPEAPSARTAGPEREGGPEAPSARTARIDAARARDRAAELVRAARPRDGEGVLIVIDQLEELITLSDPDQAARAAEVLAAVADGVPGVKALLAVRGDFLTRVAALPELGGPMTRGLHLLRVLSQADLREAVVGPARATGVAFETADMIEQIVGAVAGNPGALPLLQFTLAELWQTRDVERGVISRRTLDELGGVEGGLAHHADGVLTAMGTGQRAAARRLLLALVTREGTRASRERSELVGDEDHMADAALEAFVRGRLVMARDRAGGAPVYTLAHESLITSWGTLHRWLDDAAGQRALRVRVSAAADEWHRLGRRSDLLWTRAQLAEVAGLGELAARDRSFLAASRRRVRRRFALTVAIAAAIPAAAAITWLVLARHDHAERQQRVAEHVDAARELVRAARDTATAARTARAHAVAQFVKRGPAGADDRPDGEALWDASEAQFSDARSKLGDATSELEAALQVGVDQLEVQTAMAAAIYEQAVLADELRDASGARELERRLASYDDGTYLARWRARSEVTIAADTATRIEISTFDEGADGSRTLSASRTSSDGPRLHASLAAGSYLARIRAPGIEPVVLPFVVERARPLTLGVSLPRPGQVPPGFIYVPRGAFLHGSNDQAFFRKYFLRAPPLHGEATGAYLIARHEVTYADWMAYLRALPADERERRRPLAARGEQRSVRLEGGITEPFALVLQPTSAAHHAVEGQPLVFPGRTRQSSIKWERAPVGGIDLDSAEAYARWLSTTGRVPGGRLCTALEWERAARGADGRRFPHGDRMRPDDANFDETYGRDDRAVGPDEVGAHPASVSPFGVMDMSGNAYEWVIERNDKSALRGGSWLSGQTTAATMNSTVSQPGRKEAYIGVRLCADAP